MRPTRAGKGRKSHGRTLLIIVGGALLLAAYLTPRSSAGIPVSRQESNPTNGERQDVRPLVQGTDVERDIAAGQTQHYELTLAAGQLVRLRFEPRTVSLFVALADPGGTKLDEFELPLDPPAPPSAAFVADTPGVYRLAVRTAAQRMSGRYTLGVEELRAATPDEKGRVEAEQAFTQGAVLQLAHGDAESLRKAVQKYERARALWHAAGERAEEARALGGIGTAYVSLGEPRRAVEFYEMKLDIVRDLKDRRQEAYMSENIGLLYYSPLRDKEKALAHLTKASRLFADAGNVEGEARTLNATGKVYSELGATDDERRMSLDYFVRVLSIQRDRNNRYYEGDTLGNLMFALKELHQPREAIFFGKEAVNVFQEIRSGITDLDADTQKTFVKSKEAVYRALAALLISAGRLPEAWQVLNMLKEEEYADFVRRNGIQPPPPGQRIDLWPTEETLGKRYDEQAERLMTIGRKLAELHKKKTSMDAEEKALEKQYTNEIAEVIKAFDKYVDKMGAELGNTDYAAARQQQYRYALSLRRVMSHLATDAVALYTLVSDEKYYVLLITSELVQPYEYPIKSCDLALKVSEFRRALNDRAECPLSSAQELYRILVGPDLAKDLEHFGAKKLMWVLDGPLRYVPVAALHDGEKYLVEGYQNSLFNPLNTDPLREPPIQDWQGVGFGVSKAQEAYSLPALSWVPVELSSIFRVKGGASGIIPGQILLDDDFTKERMADILADSGHPHQIVHIASHFVLSLTHKDKSFLLIGKGEHLSLADISSMRFNGVQLLTLSACDTASVGQDDNGKEVEGFANLAQLSGADSIVASLWPVPDESTQMLMLEFYRAHSRQAGLSKIEMLQQAQLSLLRGGDTAQAEEGAADCANWKGKTAKAPFKHPHFWAPFVLIGNWR